MSCGKLSGAAVPNQIQSRVPTNDALVIAEQEACFSCAQLNAKSMCVRAQRSKKLFSLIFCSHDFVSGIRN